MLQIVIKDVGGTIFTDFLDGQPTSATVTVYSGAVDNATGIDAEVKVDAEAATVDSVSTTTSAASFAGDRSIVVASASNIRPGRRYKFGTAGSGTDENVTVRLVEGTTIHLTAPLLLDHASGAAFKGVRVSYDMDSTECDETWTPGYAVFTPNSGTPQTETVDCGLYAYPDTLCDLVDVNMELPNIGTMIDPDTDLREVMVRARDEVLQDLGPKRVRSSIGVSGLRRAAALQTILLLEVQLGPTKADFMKIVRANYTTQIERYRVNAPQDVNQNEIANEVQTGDLDGVGDLAEGTGAWEAV